MGKWLSVWGRLEARAVEKSKQSGADLGCNRTGAVGSSMAVGSRPIQPFRSNSTFKNRLKKKGGPSAAPGIVLAGRA